MTIITKMSKMSMFVILQGYQKMLLKLYCHFYSQYLFLNEDQIGSNHSIPRQVAKIRCLQTKFYKYKKKISILYFRSDLYLTSIKNDMASCNVVPRETDPFMNQKQNFCMILTLSKPAHERCG